MTKITLWIDASSFRQHIIEQEATPDEGAMLLTEYALRAISRLDMGSIIRAINAREDCELAATLTDAYSAILPWSEGDENDTD